MIGTRGCRSHYWFCGWLAPFSDIMGRILVMTTYDHAALWGNHPLSDRRNRATSFSRMTCAWSTLRFQRRRKPPEALESSLMYQNIRQCQGHICDWHSVQINTENCCPLGQPPPPPPTSLLLNPFRQHTPSSPALEIGMVDWVLNIKILTSSTQGSQN